MKSQSGRRCFILSAVFCLSLPCRTKLKPQKKGACGICSGDLVPTQHCCRTIKLERQIWLEHWRLCRLSSRSWVKQNGCQGYFHQLMNYPGWDGRRRVVLCLVQGQTFHSKEWGNFLRLQRTHKRLRGSSRSRPWLSTTASCYPESTRL